ncbi:MAG TPA: chromosomal replication initiator protein DnaA [Vulgatibacter sp.]|nr:chromosomal replication initiator protein DnaA [Vulgatibacter sp.]
MWERALAKLRHSTTDYAYENWITQIVQLGNDGQTLTLGVPNYFVRDWIVLYYADLVRRAVHSVAGEPIAIEFVIDESRKAGAQPPPAPATSQDDEVVITEVEASNGRTKLSDRFTFENFVVGPSNQLAAAAAAAVAENPGKQYNPLFIYGGTGLGKTHLLHAIGNRIRARDPKVRVVYLSAEQFLNEFVVLLKKGQMEEFRRRYREGVDVLMMDDIQVLKKAQETQNEFFHTFNDLHDSGKAIVLTSDIHPNELPNIESRLRTRFTSGLTADVYEPPFEVRIAIIKRKAEQEGVNLPDDVAQFVASKVTRSVRDLEGALTRLAAHATLTGRALSIAYAEEVLRDMLPQRQALSIEHVQKVVAKYFGMTVDDLRGEKRIRPIANARSVAMYFCRKLISDASFPIIGAAFGNKHHTTVMAAVERVSQKRDGDPALARELEELERQING